jgi:ribosome maturation factor RimP
MSWQASVERTVTGLGFDLVDVERSARGLLRVYIDRVPGHVYPEAQGGGEFVTVDDCEVVTRQLLLVLEVDNVAYERLAGQAVDVKLKLAFQGRKHWRGVLGRKAEAWSLALEGDKAGSEMEFKLDEVQEARLVPVIDFKGRGRAARAAG